MDLNLSWHESYELDSPHDFRNRHQSTNKINTLVSETRESISNIINGKSNKLIVIVGPCSIHDKASALEYASMLAKVSKNYPNLQIIMRAYFEKPRTILGWKGFIYDPMLDNSYQLKKGLTLSREILLGILDLGIVPGTEFLDTILPQYLIDLIGWVAIGARTSESQIHRQLASGLSCPVGFKNSSSGDTTVAINAAKASSYPHFFPGINSGGKACLISTRGNDNTHIIHRGSYENGCNFSSRCIMDSSSKLKKQKLAEKIIVDCSHGNSGKDHTKQKLVIKSLMGHIKRHGLKYLAGVMIESHINSGKQNLIPREKLEYGVSITDSCIGFTETMKLLRILNDTVDQLASGVCA